MADCLIPYLEKLLASMEKDAERCKKKSQDALFLKPYTQWTEADRERYQKTDTEKMLAEFDKWMKRQVDVEFAAGELRNLLFVRRLSRGH